jgi:hypothetical protein
VEAAVNDEAVDRFFTRFAELQSENEPKPPHGLVAQGLVRTTGWLQVGTRPISSGLIVAVIGLLVALVIAIPALPTDPVVGVLIPLLPEVGYAGWWMLITRILPASSARNVKTVAAEELPAGSWVRLHGSIGPVGEVESTCPRGDAAIEVTFTGGATKIWLRDDPLHVVELLN